MVGLTNSRFWRARDARSLLGRERPASPRKGGAEVHRTCSPPPASHAAILCYLEDMNASVNIAIRHSTCPHDCPSACALDVEVIDGTAIGRVRGSKLQSYTAGVVCAKVARYAERIHHPDRLKIPMRRTGPKGSGRFA